MNIYFAATKGYEYLMRLYLAGTWSRDYCFTKEQMKIYLAGEGCYVKDKGTWEEWPKNDLMILESFFYVKEWQIPFIPQFKSFLLDSGAFTFMQNAGARLNWEEYLERYAAFINQQKIDLFFELDIDSIVGIKEVERLRDKLETLTNKRCIPVWHKSRGLDYWEKMSRDYDYIAIGGIVSGELKKPDYQHFPALLKIAKDNGAKVHGLGFTNLDGLTKYKFDSVDSTAWLYGNRGGFVYWFDGKTLQKVKAKEGQRLNAKQAAIHNFNEWVKFQKYAEKYL